MEFYTPPWVFDLIDVYFDIDVCSTAEIDWIPAETYFDKGVDGLSQQWKGVVWMNPPFSDCNTWVRKFMKHNNGVALLPVSKSRWFDELVAMPHQLKFLPSTLKFIHNGSNASIRTACCLVALGDCIGKLG